jgi:hypothetical protein
MCTSTLADARQIIATAERRAIELGQPQNIAVVDAGGNMIVHARMDGGPSPIEPRHRPMPVSWAGGDAGQESAVAVWPPVTRRRSSFPASLLAAAAV